MAKVIVLVAISTDDVIPLPPANFISWPSVKLTAVESSPDIDKDVPDIVLLAIAIVLFVKVSDVFLATTVSVALGNVSECKSLPSPSLL